MSKRCLATNRKDSSRLGARGKQNAFLPGCRFGTFPLPTRRLVPSCRPARLALLFFEAKGVLPPLPATESDQDLLALPSGTGLIGAASRARNLQRRNAEPDKYGGARQFESAVHGEDKVPGLPPPPRLAI